MPFELGLAYFLTWLYDNDWYSPMQDHVKSYEAYGVIGFISCLVFVYLMHFIFKNIVHRLFVAVVIEGFRRIHAINSFVFNERLIK